VDIYHNQKPWLFNLPDLIEDLVGIDRLTIYTENSEYRSLALSTTLKLQRAHPQIHLRYYNAFDLTGQSFDLFIRERPECFDAEHTGFDALFTGDIHRITCRAG